MKRRENSGFTVIELLTTLVIIGVLIRASVSMGSSLYKDFKFTDYISRIEYVTKFSKLYATQKSIYVGICVDSSKKVITLRDLGARYTTSVDICNSAYTIIKKIDLSKEGLLQISAKNNANPAASVNGFVFDGRGIAVNQGKVCITNKYEYSTVNISLSGVSSGKGNGLCP